MPSPGETRKIASKGIRKVKNLTADTTLNQSESGSVVTLNSATSLTVNLPKASPGLEFTFVSKLAPSSGVGYSLSPQSTDKINRTTGVTNKDLINTQATAALGDAVKLIAVSSTEWQVLGIVGTWAKEA